MLRYTLTLICCLLTAPLMAQSSDGPRLLVMGDSLLAANTPTGKSIGSTAAKVLGASELREMAMPAAQMLYRLPVSGAMGLRISKQYRKGDWDWIILNGGGNDLLFGCDCGPCGPKMDRLISAAGTTGEIPRLVSELRATGARIAYVGYLRSPGFDTPVEHCKAVGDELERRLSKMARRDRGVYFLSNADLVPQGDLSFHDWDRVHPSAKGSQSIGNALARLIHSAGAR